ncbi:4-diphosphocytidyl-2C-methyl-D-erythritol kinase [Chloropicon primus]|uniref:4-diphosphocytidyl-2C-methyl-D-erythritol kinase n=1 Tax=Chloropicon primus TaxID=1764295 RepID=A0A5B8MM63_9CHLO|nr:4-diphosphocytidyl-2C-methyl-D-erythritol kinase [Chloropicon primus]UPQ99599.1 4-diphosphocytidyl-2C-methyl-D-erythritol kinase [Chloropicon primus]|eukprot:QDZ20390.1 4-diphosphocytidyl-2C-methyl-D-erythritol kinase [Chloropicon primus]
MAMATECRGRAEGRGRRGATGSRMSGSSRVASSRNWVWTRAAASNRGKTWKGSERVGRQRQVRARGFKFEDVSEEGVGVDELDLFSPAKINLFLRITKRRPDGFHELASLFQTIAFGDTMKISKLASNALEDEILCSDPSVPCDKRNLVWKAADLFREKTGSTQKFKIDLRKEVPAGAGLGGGSGNAATMLWAANKLCDLDHGDPDLLEWSGDIGSDISFFFSSGTAYCTGRGEVVEDMPPALPSNYPIILIKPSSPLSTAAVYKKLDVTKCSEADPEELKRRFYQEALMASSERKPCTEHPQQELCVNDLELPAFEEMPILLKAKEELIASDKYASVFMSGSGSTLVCLGAHDLDENPSFEKETQDQDWLAVLTEPVNRTAGQWYEKSMELRPVSK